MSSLKITNLSAFNKALKEVLVKNEMIQKKIVVKVAMDAHRELQRVTPHKTNRARGSWTNTVNSPPTEWAHSSGKSYYPLTPFKGEQRITAFTAVNISNNVEYIIPLEEGHSKQNKHMVRKTVSKLTAQLNQLTRKESQRRIR